MPVLKNPQHEIFAQEVARGAKQTEAARAAGYKSVKQNAHRLSVHEGISARVKEIQTTLIRKIEKKLDVSLDRLVHEFARMGFSDVTDVVKVRNGKMYIEDTDNLPPDVTAAISSLKQTKDGVEVRFHPKAPALDALAKHIGMYKENINVSVTLSLADMVNASYQQPAVPAGPVIEHDE